MAEARIPVDPFNPGQVFACLGLLEAADVLLGEASGGFDWTDPARTEFRLSACGADNPVATVLAFLAEADAVPVAPRNVEGPWPDECETSEIFPAGLRELRKSDGKGLTANALPAILRAQDREVFAFHWIDGSVLDTFKLFAGNQVGWNVLRLLLSFDEQGSPRKGARQLWHEHGDCLMVDPFGAASPDSPFLVPVDKGKFGFDARGAWDAIRAGTSLDAHNYSVRISPLVELLAAIGLSYARPVSGLRSEARYAAWTTILTASLCRVALAHPQAVLTSGEFRTFRTHTGNDKYYKKFFYAEEETET